MSNKRIRQLIRGILAEAEMIKVKGKKFALNDGQVDSLLSYLENETRTGVDELGEFEEKVADAGDPDTVYKYLVKALEEEAPEKVAQFKQLVDNDWSKIARKDGGILDALKILSMQASSEESPGDGIEKLINAMFSASGVAPGVLETPAFLDPLFDVFEPGRSDTMGRGEVLLAFSFAGSSGDAGGEYDVTLEKKNYHVKDLRGDESGGSDNDVPLGKNAAWDKSLFPFNILKSGGANPGELTLAGMKKAWPAVQGFYDDPEKAASVGFTGNSSDPNEVAEHFQKSMDKVLVESDAFKGGGAESAAGVIFAAGRKFYLVPPSDLHFNRTSQSAIRVAPGSSVPFGTSLENLMPYRAAMSQVKDSATSKILDKSVEMSLEDIVASKSYWEDGTEAVITQVLQRLRKMSSDGTIPEPDNKWPAKSHTKAVKFEAIEAYLKAQKVQKLEAYHRPSENLFVENCIISYMIKKESQKEQEKYVRLLIRESLLAEELNKSDKKEIERIAKKQASKIVASELDKALGASFFGTKGKVNKFVSDEVSKRFKAGRRDPDFADTVETICKEILKKFHRDMALKYPQMVDRIKIR